MRSVEAILLEQNELRMLRDPLSLPGEPQSSQRLQPRRRRVDPRSKGYASRGKPTTSTPALLEQVLALRAQGLSHGAIGAALKVSRSTIGDWLARGGL